MKFIYVLSLAIILSLTLAACGNDVTTKQKPNTNAKQTTVKENGKIKKSNKESNNKEIEKANLQALTQKQSANLEKYTGTWDVVPDDQTQSGTLVVTKNEDGTLHINSTVEQSPYDSLDYQVTSTEVNKIYVNPTNQNYANLTDVLTIDSNGNLQIVAQRKAIIIIYKKGNGIIQAPTKPDTINTDKYIGTWNVVPDDTTTSGTINVTKNANGTYHIKTTGIDDSPYNDLDYQVTSVVGNKIYLNPTNQNYANLTNIFTVNNNGGLEIIAQRKAFAAIFSK